MPYLRFYRRIPIIPGLLHLNLSKGGVSISIGKRGFGITFGKYGIRFTAGLTGTGLFVTEHVNYDRIKKIVPDNKAHLGPEICLNKYLGGDNGAKEKK